MGGVDKMDQFISTYRTHIRQRKWWWSIFVYFLDVSVVNAWLLSRKFGYNMPLLDFKRYIAKSLLKSYGTLSSQGKIPPTVVKDVRFDGLGHYPRSVQTEKLCRHCRGKAKFICSKCEVGVHPKCFKIITLKHNFFSNTCTGMRFTFPKIKFLLFTFNNYVCKWKRKIFYMAISLKNKVPFFE